MEVWIIRDGEKAGPFHDFEVRRQIESGELTDDTMGWHEGLALWQPLREMSIFAREFELRKEIPAAAQEASEKILPPPLPVDSRLGRRFWARWFDMTAYAGIWWFGMWAAGQNIGAALLNAWLMFFQFVPWFLLEILLIHYFATTPGKWLLGLQVLNKDGSRLSLNESTRRSMRVMFTGVGFGWGPLALFCQAISLFTAKRIGSPLWDHLGGHQVVPAPLHPAKVTVLVVLFFAALQLQAIVVSPYMLESAGKSMPWLKEEMEKNPPWHLPKRA